MSASEIADELGSIYGAPVDAATVSERLAPILAEQDKALASIRRPSSRT